MLLLIVQVSEFIDMYSDHFCLFNIAALITFNQSVYMVGESDEEVYLTINLSNKTSRSIGLILEVLTNGTNATSRYCVCLKHVVIV